MEGAARALCVMRCAGRARAPPGLRAREARKLRPTLRPRRRAAPRRSRASRVGPRRVPAAPIARARLSSDAPRASSTCPGRARLRRRRRGTPAPQQAGAFAGPRRAVAGTIGDGAVSGVHAATSRIDARSVRVEQVTTTAQHPPPRKAAEGRATSTGGARPRLAATCRRGAGVLALTSAAVEPPAVANLVRTLESSAV